MASAAIVSSAAIPFMAIRKMTSSISEQALIRSCSLANQDLEITAIEQEWDQIGDTIEEPWSESPPQ